MCIGCQQSGLMMQLGDDRDSCHHIRTTNTRLFYFYGCGKESTDRGDDTVSEVSEVEVREWGEEQGAGAEKQGAGGITIIPAHACLHGVCRRGEEGAVTISFVLPSFVLFFVIFVVRFYFFGTDRVEGKGELAMCRHRADIGQETDCT